MTENEEALIDGLRRAAHTGRDMVVTANQAEMIVALLDITSHAKYDAMAAAMLANSVLASIRKEKVKR